MKYEVSIVIKNGVLDPEMATLQRHLERVGQKGIKIEQKTIYEIEIPEGKSPEEEKKIVTQIAEEFLANPEIHNWKMQRIE